MNDTIPPHSPAPYDIERVVRAAVAALPPSGGDITRVRTGASRRRRRRLMAQSAIAAVLVAVVAIGVPTVGRLWSQASGPSPAAPASPSVSVAPTFSVAPGQILLSVRERPMPTVEGLPVIVAVKADGAVTEVPKPSGFRLGLQHTTTPDGRIIVVGRKDTGLVLAVLASDGTVMLTRPLASGRDGSVVLSAASDTEVFLNRDTVFVAHDLVTGVERELRRMGGSVPNVIVAHASRDTVVVAPGDLGEASCAAALLDPQTGQQRRMVKAPLAACTPFDVRLSPDGRYLAMLVPLPPDRSKTRLYILDAATGTAVRDFLVPPGTGGGVGFIFSGWGWSGPSTVRVVRGSLPTVDLTHLAEALQTSTFTV
jgi:hypothetical protein